MFNLRNTILAVVITALLGYLYGTLKFREGIELGKREQIALQAEADSKIKEIREEMKLAVAESLKEIQIKNVTIHQKAIKEIQTKEIYRECKVPQEGKDLIKEALEGRK